MEKNFSGIFEFFCILLKGKRYMKHDPVTVRTSVNFQPSFRLVDLFVEQTSYTKSWETKEGRW